MNVSSFSIGSVVLVRFKKLKGGRNATRKVVIIDKGIKTTLLGEGPVKKIQAIVDHKHVQATLDGTIDTATGTIRVDVSSCVLTGYMKHRNFIMTGHMPRASITNLNVRVDRRGAKPAASKVSTPRTPHVSGRKRSKF